MSHKRVVITGIGMLCSIGNSVEESWNNAKLGKSNMSSIECFDTSSFDVKFASQILNLDKEKYLSKKDIRRTDPFIHYALIASLEAFKDSNLEVNEKNSHRMGIAIGSGIGGLYTIENNIEIIRQKGLNKVSPFFIPASIINMAAGNVSIKLGFKGPSFAISTACATGSHNIGVAYRTIQYGDADVMLAGSSEFSTTKSSLSGFNSAKTLSTRNDMPNKASRPWDMDRDGFVLGEGAGVLVLEEYEHAKKRGANIYAEIIGFNMNSDAYHITSPSLNGFGASTCMSNALQDARINKEDIDYINAHGTSTKIGDIAETLAIKKTFKDYSKKLYVSSTKSMIGHLLGAASSVEAIFSVLTIKDQIAHPTINLDNADKECDLNYLPHTAKELNINYVMSNSFGFGGTNTSLIFTKLK